MVATNEMAETVGTIRGVVTDQTKVTFDILVVLRLMLAGYISTRLRLPGGSRLQPLANQTQSPFTGIAPQCHVIIIALKEVTI